MPIYGFDGFNVGKSIEIPKGWPINVKEGSVQPNQDYSRDYSRFTEQQAWELCYEYFEKDKNDDILYEMIYKGM